MALGRAVITELILAFHEGPHARSGDVSRLPSTTSELERADYTMILNIIAVDRLNTHRTSAVIADKGAEKPSTPPSA